VCDRRWRSFEARRNSLDSIRRGIAGARAEGMPMIDWIRRADPGAAEVAARLEAAAGASAPLERGAHPSFGIGAPSRAALLRLVDRVVSDLRYEGYLRRQEVEVRRQRDAERTPIPVDLDPSKIPGLRREAAEVLHRFRPTTMGQASRLAGVNPADVTLLAVAIARARRAAAERASPGAAQVE